MGAVAWLTPIRAADFRGAAEIVVAAGEVIDDDLYVTGGTITIDGTVRGDVIAAGRQVTINGTVEGDLIACGQAVVVNGRVGDDIRMAGMALNVGPGATVGDDIVAAGFSLEMEPDSRAGGALTMAGFQTLLAGTVDGDAQFAGAGLELRGRIGGDLDAEVEPSAQAPPFAMFMPAPIPLPTVAGGLTLGDGAEVGGGLTYQSSAEGRISSAATVTGELVRIEPETSAGAPGTAAAGVIGRVRDFIALLLVGVLLAWAAPGWLTGRADQAIARPFMTLVWGLGVVVGVVTAMIAVAVLAAFVAILTGLLTLSGLVALTVVLAVTVDALLGLGLALTLGFAAPLVVGLAVGRRLLPERSVDGLRGLIAPLAAGLALVVLLRAIPVLGPLVGLLVAIAGTGSIGVWAARTVRRQPRAV